MADFVRVDHEALRAARMKFLKLGREIEAGASQGDLIHTKDKLGMFLDEALKGAFSASNIRVPDTLPESAEEES